MYISRCGKGFGALKDQGTTNQIVYRFIADYNTLFLDPGEDPPAVYWVSIFLEVGDEKLAYISYLGQPF